MHDSAARHGRRRTLAIGVALAAAISLTGVSTASAIGPTLPGANNPNCKPTAAHPRPVVLVHATLSNQQQNWSTLGPQLMAQGYCVWALNYGVTAASLGGTIDGLGEISHSAGQLRNF